MTKGCLTGTPFFYGSNCTKPDKLFFLFLEMKLVFILNPDFDSDPALQGINISHLDFLDWTDSKTDLQISFHLTPFCLVNEIKPVIVNRFHHSPVSEEIVISDPYDG